MVAQDFFEFCPRRSPRAEDAATALWRRSTWFEARAVETKPPVRSSPAVYRPEPPGGHRCG